MSLKNSTVIVVETQNLKVTADTIMRCHHITQYHTNIITALVTACFAVDTVNNTYKYFGKDKVFLQRSNVKFLQEGLSTVKS